LVPEGFKLSQLSTPKTGDGDTLQDGLADMTT
jgi:hypothetical protein